MLRLFLESSFILLLVSNTLVPVRVALRYDYRFSPRSVPGFLCLLFHRRLTWSFAVPGAVSPCTVTTYLSIHTGLSSALSSSHLDLAKELDSLPSGAPHRTGTMQFMAIEVLEGKGHTYRHDLESFFYVFIWMCIRHGHDDMDDKLNGKKWTRPAAISRLRDW